MSLQVLHIGLVLLLMFAKLAHGIELLDNGDFVRNLAHIHSSLTVSNASDLSQTVRSLLRGTGGGSLGYEFYNQWKRLPKDVPSEKCLAHLGYIVGGLAQGSMTSLKFFDSWAKLPSGILQGHLMDFGNFDECIRLHKELPGRTTFKGKYCLTSLPLGSTGEIPFALNLGLCIPAACTATEFDVIFSTFLKLQFNITIAPEQGMITERLCQVEEKDPLTGVQWFAISVAIILGCAMLISSIFDFYYQYTKKPVNKILVSFSVPMNLSALLKVTPNNKASPVIPCLNGIRVLSIVWVIWGHGFTFNNMLPTINTFDAFSWARTAFSMLLQYAPFSVDTFFFLSGFLVSLLALKEMDRRSGKLNIPMMYLHRFLRLTPMVALCILFYYALFPIMTTGPIWPNINNFYEVCRTNWWAALLYIQNYAYTEEMCVGHTWYLDVDMQLFILSPIFLYLLYNWRSKGVVVIVILQLLLLACVFSTIEVKSLSFHVMGIGMASMEAMKSTYFPTHTRTAPWIVGLLFGYFVFTRKGQRTKIPKIFAVFGWLVCFLLVATVLFVWYPHAQKDGPKITVTEEAFYWTFSRVAWPLALCWIVFASMNGYGGFIGDFLSCPLWQPLAKLSFCMYMWHLFMEGITAGGTRSNIYFSNYNMFSQLWFNLTWSVLIAIVMYLAFEAPLVNLEKILLHPKREAKPVVVVEKPHIEPIHQQTA